MTTLELKSAKWLSALVLLTSGAAAQAVPTLGFDLDTLSVQVGDSFVLLLQGTGFDSTADGLAIDNLSGGQKLNLSFPAAALQLESVVIDPRWSFAAANKTGVIDNAAGTLTGLAFGTFPATADDSFDIARISFTALDAGAATVAISAAQLIGRVNNLAGTTIAASTLPSAVQVSAVPEPQAWAMLAAGLGWLALRSRRA